MAQEVNQCLPVQTLRLGKHEASLLEPCGGAVSLADADIQRRGNRLIAGVEAESEVEPHDEVQRP
jgi:hypothetical protein